MSMVDLFAPSSETRRLSTRINPTELHNLGMSNDEANDFLQLRKRYLEKPLVEWNKVEPPPADFYKTYDSLRTIDQVKPDIKKHLEKLVVIQLNGGLGTAMGMKGPKSSLQILKKSGTALTILDCKVLQIEKLNEEWGVDVPLVLMDSPNTDENTSELLKRYEGSKVKIYTFNQSEHPLMYKDTLSPLPQSKDERNHWYPPGSGEIFTCMDRSGLLEHFLSEGKEYLYIANVENLGASVDLRILDFLAHSSIEFLLELTNRISTDVSGGVPVKYKDRKVHILEMSQVPFLQHTTQFSISQYKYWNTNNIWTKLSVIKEAIIDKQLELDFIVKQRSIKGRNALQIETPVSMSIHNFPKSAGILVPRSRYIQVKTTSNLLAAQSELYTLEKGVLVMNPRRVPASEPLIKLGEEFKTLDQYEARFKTIPNILELDHLTVSGDVTFGSNVTLKGTVIIVAETGSRIDIPDGSLLENKIVSGSLQICEN